MTSNVLSTRVEKNHSAHKGPQARLIVRIAHPGSRSKYQPHQGERERARRLRQRGGRDLDAAA